MSQAQKADASWSNHVWSTFHCSTILCKSCVYYSAKQGEVYKKQEDDINNTIKMISKHQNHVTIDN